MKRTFLSILFYCSCTLYIGVYAQGAGKALMFDGVSNYVTTPYIKLPAGLTYTCWMRTSSTDNAAVYAGNAALNILGDNTNDVYVGFGVHNGRVRFNSCGLFPCPGGWSHFDGATLVNDGRWHHLAVTYATSGQVLLYVDGVLDGTGHRDYDVNYVAFNRIGGGYINGTATSDIYDGVVDEVRVYNYVLAPEALRYRMCERLVGAEPGLVAYWRMDEGADNTCPGGQDVCDASGNGHHGVKF